MQHIIFILTLFSFNLSSLGQKPNVDNLLDRIDNKQVIIMNQYISYPKMFSAEGDTLIKIGKPVSDKLLRLLNDTSKGIITHFILSTIWSGDLKKAGWKVGSGVSYIQNNLDTVTRIYLNGLTFYQDNNFKLFAGQDELNRNKKEWLTFIQTKSSG